MEYWLPDPGCVDTLMPKGPGIFFYSKFYCKGLVIIVSNKTYILDRLLSRVEMRRFPVINKLHDTSL